MAFFWIATHLCGKPEPPLSVLGPPFRTQRPARALCMSANSLVSLAASQTRCWNPSSWFWDLSRALFSLRLNTGRSVPLSPESACFQLAPSTSQAFYWILIKLWCHLIFCQHVQWDKTKRCSRRTRKQSLPVWVWHKRNGMPAHGKRLLEPWLGTRSNGKSW